MPHRLIRGVLGITLGIGLVAIGMTAGAEQVSGTYDSGPQPSPSRTERRSSHSSETDRPDMGPPMDEMMRQGMQRMAAGMAMFARAYYQALVSEGFSAEEAVRIVENADFPSFGPHL